MAHQEKNAQSADGWEQLRAKTKSAPLLCNPIVDRDAQGLQRVLKDDISLFWSTLFASAIVLLGVLPGLSFIPFLSRPLGKSEIGMMIGAAFVGLPFVAFGIHIFVASRRRYHYPVQLMIEPTSRDLRIRMGSGPVSEVELVVPRNLAKIALRYDDARRKYSPYQDEAYCVSLEVLIDGPDGPKECIRILRDRSYGKLLSLCLELLSEDRSGLFRDETLVPVRLRSGETVELTTAPRGETASSGAPRIPDRGTETIVFKRSTIKSLCAIFIIGLLSILLGGAGSYTFAMAGNYAGAAMFVLLTCPWAVLSVAGSFIELSTRGSGIEIDLARREMRIDRRVGRKMCQEIVVFPKIDCIQMTAVATNDSDIPYLYSYEVDVVDRGASLRRHALLKHEDYDGVLAFARFLSEEMGVPLVNHVPEECSVNKVCGSKPRQ